MLNLLIVCIVLLVLFFLPGNLSYIYRNPTGRWGITLSFTSLDSWSHKGGWFLNAFRDPGTVIEVPDPLFFAEDNTSVETASILQKGLYFCVLGFSITVVTINVSYSKVT